MVNNSCIIQIEIAPQHYFQVSDLTLNAQVRRVTPVQQQVVQGSSVTLECHADGNPPAAISWSRQKGHLPSGARAVEVTIIVHVCDRPNA